MSLVKFMIPRKTHGNQYNMIGIKYDTDQDPLVRITFFPQTTYVQIQCLTDKIKTALFNFTVLKNYFELDDPYDNFYEVKDGQWSVKKEFKQQYADKFVNKYFLNEPDLTGFGTTKFNTKQFLFQQQDSQIEDLQINDHIAFGADDRYQYQNLVNDIQKRPIQIPHVMYETVKSIIQLKGNENADLIGGSTELGEAQLSEAQLSGGKKGSPVYCNIQYDYSNFLKYQQIFVIQGFLIKNQTFDGIYTKYRCSNNFPYMLLGNTNGKDSISCAIDPMNPEGISLFEFYDVGLRLLWKKEYLQYLRKLLYGRVSISATKYTQWASPGRCSECPLNLKKMLSQNILFLSCMSEVNDNQSDTKILLEQTLDQEWFESVFGQSYNSLFDGEIIYDYSDQQFYTTNIDGKNQSFWVKFFNHRQYLVIMDDIKISENKKHYYIPFYYKQKLYKRNQDFDLDYYESRFNILGYVKIDSINTNYIYTKQGMFPLQDSVRDLRLFDNIEVEDKLPTFEAVSKLINDFDNFIINGDEEIIGTNYRGLKFYWKGTKFQTDQKFTLGAYPLGYVQMGVINKQINFNQYVCAYSIYQYIKQIKYIQNPLIKLDTDINMLNEILSDFEIVYKIFEFYGRVLQEAHKDREDFHKYPLILKQITKSKIKEGLQTLKRILPNTDQMKLDYIKSLSRFSKNRSLHYFKENREEIFVLNSKREYTNM